MNIFYYSVHSVLEDDELRLFQSLGHNVFCIGANIGGDAGGFRPAITFNFAEKALHAAYERAGGRYQAAASPDELLPPGFIEHFSASVVMHDVTFISAQWHKLKARPVIWRTIGQGMRELEHHLAAQRVEGLRIARYSDVEDRIPGFIGQDDVIRFYKSADEFRNWTGDQEEVLVFSNALAQRYPEEARAIGEVLAGFPHKIGGAGNEALPGAIGLVDAREQRELYRRSRVYLYATGLHIPYTLNFVEAWVTGTPVVVLAPEARRGEFFEVDHLVKDGRNGFVCRDVASARARISELLDNEALARRISAAGRADAIRWFGAQRAGEQWQRLFEGRRSEISSASPLRVVDRSR